MTNKPSAPREFQCQYDPDTNELKYAHNHGCSDGWEDVHLVEHSAYLAALEKCKELEGELEIIRNYESSTLGRANAEIKTLRNQVSVANLSFEGIKNIANKLQCLCQPVNRICIKHLIYNELQKTLEAKGPL